GALMSSDIPPDNPTGPAKSAQDFLRSMKITAGARFAAHERLGSHDRELTRITAFTSTYLILLTITPYFIHLPKEVEDNINLAIPIFSIIVLVFSLLQYSTNEVVNAEQHHRSALEINELKRELQIVAEHVDEESLKEYAREYSRILQKYSVNHADIDLDKY